MKRLLALICCIVYLTSFNIISASNIVEERIIHKEKNGFRWIEVYQKEDRFGILGKVAALSINGDTIIPYSLGCKDIQYHDFSREDPGGYEAIFIIKKDDIEAAIDLSGEVIILFEKELWGISPDQTKDGKLFFKFKYAKNKKFTASKYGLLDINGEYIVPLTKKYIYIYDDYIETGKKRIPFPNIPISNKYEIIRNNNKTAINNSIIAYRDLQLEKIIHKEKDGFVWTETSNGLYVGAEGSSGNVIIPLDYDEIKYIPIPNRDGIFLIKKTIKYSKYKNQYYKYYAFDTKGEMLIDKKNTIHYIQSTPDIPGYLVATLDDNWGRETYIFYDTYGKKITSYKNDHISYDPDDGLCYKGVPINVKIDKLGHADISKVKDLYAIESDLKNSKNKTPIEPSYQQQRGDYYSSFFPVISTKNLVNPNILNTMPVFGTISTVHTQEEYEEFCRNNKKSDGSNYSFEEYLQIRWPVNSEQSGSYNTQNNNNGSSNNNNGSSNRSKQWRSCNHCNGTGVCPACKNGVFYDKTFGTGSQGKKCHSCNGSGICPICKGQKGLWRHY